jgi:hypothetical protein
LLDCDLTKTLYFFEPGGEVIGPILSPIPTLATVSPDTRLYKEYRKQQGAITLYMPVGPKMIYWPLGRFTMSNLMKEKLRERFADFGGIFRHIFAPPLSYMGLMQLKDSAILSAGEIVHRILVTETLEDISLSHFLIQFSNIPTETVDPDAFLIYSLRPINDKIEILLKKQRDKLSFLEKVDLLNKFRASRYIQFAALIPGYYQDFIYFLLLKNEFAGWQFRAASSGGVILPYEPLVIPCRLNSTTVHFPQYSKMKSGVLYYPLTQNFKLVDLVFKEEKGKYIGFQVSVERGGKRKVSGPSLRNFLRNFNDVDQFTYYYVPLPEFADQATITIEGDFSDDEKKKVDMQPSKSIRNFWNRSYDLLSPAHYLIKKCLKY